MVEMMTSTRTSAPSLWPSSSKALVGVWSPERDGEAASAR
jgi:hypothetical protein